MKAVFVPSAVPFALRLASFCVIILACSIPISVALDNVLLLLLLILVLFGAGREVGRVAVDNPVARGSVMLFGALCLGSAYGVATLAEAAATLGKYADLLFVPILMVAGKNRQTRHSATLLFIGVMLLTAVLSWSVGSGLLPPQQWMWLGHLPMPLENPAVFRSSITQNILMAYATYLVLLQSRTISGQRMKWLWFTAAAVMASSILFLVQGKTGYLVIFGLLTYFSWVTWSRLMGARGYAMSWREVAGLGMLVLFLTYSAYHLVPRLHERVNQATADFKEWQPGTHYPTSTGERLEFYSNTLSLVEQHPLLGVGTGGFPAAYAQKISDTGVGKPTRNPHNEYLLITAQIGVGGLLLLLYLFFTQWRHAARLPTTFEQDAARGLVLTIAITAMFNSPLLDHTEGLFFAYASALLFANLNMAKRDA